jgi:hypothetical protein
MTFYPESCSGNSARLGIGEVQHPGILAVREVAIDFIDSPGWQHLHERFFL